MDFKRKKSKYFKCSHQVFPVHHDGFIKIFFDIGKLCKVWAISKQKEERVNAAWAQKVVAGGITKGRKENDDDWKTAEWKWKPQEKKQAAASKERKKVCFDEIKLFFRDDGSNA